MHLLRRRILYAIFILLFLIITPLISLYANGYRFGRGMKLQKTGILMLNSEPKGAFVYIDNKIQKKFFNGIINQKKGYITTPAKIKGILPGDYEVRFEMENYWPWQKKLSIVSGQSTFAENVTLFKKDLPINILDGPVQSFSFSPNGKYLAGISGADMVFFDPETGTRKAFEIPAGPATSSGINWSQNSEKAIYDGLILDKNNWERPLELSRTINSANNDLIEWGESDDQIYYLSSQGIHRYDTEAKINKTIIKEVGISDFLIKNNNLFYIKQTEKNTELNIYELDRNSKENEAGRLLKYLALPYSDYKFINTRHRLLNLYDSRFEILYLIDPFSPIRPLKETVNNITKSLWVNDSKLLYANDFEIWLYDLGNYNKTILTRISEKIDKIIWHPNNNYIIYNTDKCINILELDKREKYNITGLICLDNINNLHLGKRGDMLYFFARIGNQQGIYKLSIR